MAGVEDRGPVRNQHQEKIVIAAVGVADDVVGLKFRIIGGEEHLQIGTEAQLSEPGSRHTDGRYSEKENEPAKTEQLAGVGVDHGMAYILVGMLRILTRCRDGAKYLRGR